MRTNSKEIAPEKKKLTGKEERFCSEYFKDFNGARAARDVGYSVHSAREIAVKLLAKPHIKTKIAEMKANIAEVAMISPMQIINEHRKIAYSTIASLLNTWIDRKDFDELTEDDKACIKSISTKVIKQNIGTSESPNIVDVEYVKLELYDKQKSLELLAKMTGADAPTKIQLSGTGEDGAIVWQETKSYDK